VELLALLPVTFAGSVVWFLNPEAASMLYVAAGGFHPLAVGLVAAVGQAAALLVLWSGGRRLRAIWPWLDRQCRRVQVRWGRSLQRSTIPAAAVSGLLGVPPASATAVLAPGLGLPAAVVLPLLIAGRLLRFTALAFLAARMQ
jgi:membrane protein YqaA with SNARE-associated domain